MRRWMGIALIVFGVGASMIGFVQPGVQYWMLLVGATIGVGFMIWRYGD